MTEQPLLRAIQQALDRYDDPKEPHNTKQGGFPRKELGWAMANDLRNGLKNHYSEKKET